MRCKLIKVNAENKKMAASKVNAELLSKDYTNIRILSINLGWLNDNFAYQTEVAYEDNNENTRKLKKVKTKKYQ